MNRADLENMAQRELQRQQAFRCRILCCASTPCLSSGGQAVYDAINAVITEGGWDAEVQAVAGISFDIAAGESFGLLGPNGAGKSTTMRMIGGTPGRSGGHLAGAGLDPEVEGSTVRAHLGVVPQQDNLDEELSVRDNLYIYGRYFGLPRSYLRAKIPELLDFAQLSEKSSAKVDRLSGGCLLYTSPSPRDRTRSRMPSSA